MSLRGNIVAEAISILQRCGIKTPRRGNLTFGKSMILLRSSPVALCFLCGLCVSVANFSVFSVPSVINFFCVYPCSPRPCVQERGSSVAIFFSLLLSPHYFSFITPIKQLLSQENGSKSLHITMILIVIYENWEQFTSPSDYLTRVKKVL